jgi:hypothetical protein
MASYKVLQDIEAEDTLVGPLTLRQCIYAAIAILAAYLSFIVISKGAPFLALFMLPFIAFGAFFAFPWSKQQPTEVWALAKVRFYFKPRRRIWNQSGAKQLVTITVPKTVKRSYTSNLTPSEVKSRLKALADTIDSRGWAIKNVGLGYYGNQALAGNGSDSDRLVNAANLPREVPTLDPEASTDIFDMQHSPVAQKFDMLMTQAADVHRQQIMQQMVQPQPAVSLGGPAGAAGQGTVADNYWHMRTIAPLPHNGQTGGGPAPSGQPQAATTNVSSAASTVTYDVTLPAPINYADNGSVGTNGRPAVDYSGLRTSVAQPLAAAGIQPAGTSYSPMTEHPNPAILELANNNDLNVATIAREAQARSAEPPDEVVVSLH